jgi:leader peptidase (prepilin peptidase)/N-methyltransferase
LRAHQLAEDKKNGEEIDEAEYKRLKRLIGKKGKSDRSIDLDTGKQLPWYDLIPVVSWLLLRGKSRFSGKFIGWFEFVIEVGVALFFVGSYVFWPGSLTEPLEIAKFVVWLIAGVVLAVQFATDFKWQILWSTLNYATIALGLVYAALTIFGSDAPLNAFYSVLGSVGALGGLYFVLYVVSRERWVGLGDAFLGVGLGLLLSDWMLSVLTLFLANLLGTIVVLGGFLLKKLSRHQHVPFGPFLIAATVISLLWGHIMIDWYLSTFSISTML